MDFLDPQLYHDPAGKVYQECHIVGRSTLYVLHTRGYTR